MCERLVYGCIMAAKTKARTQKTGNVNLHVMLPVELLSALDEKVAEYAKGGTWPKPSRTDLIRNVLSAAVKHWKNIAQKSSESP